ncbi:MAG: ABC transporter substrate-binding protein [Chloroflexi bacterium]|nr:ABC transporter substrate-binding protein [Chloroflexota bacterium]
MNKQATASMFMQGTKDRRTSMKRILILLLVTGLLCSVPATVMPVDAQIGDAPAVFTVGLTTMLNGNFFSELWGNNTADIDVRSLLHEYPIVAQTQAGEYQLNYTVISQIGKKTEANGDITYRVTLREGLKYSDGSPISARDYLFSFLLLSSSHVQTMTGVMPPYAYITGFDEYNNGSTKVLSGLHLLDELTFTLRIKNEYLPYFYEIAYININPYPISVIVPGAHVADDGNGAYISGEMTVDLLRNTILDSVNGYLSHPSVTSGPYRLLSYDSQSHVAEFEINPYYKGNYEGQIPAIPRLRFQHIHNQNILQQITQGQVDLVNKVVDGEVIDMALELENSGYLTTTAYPRTGAGYLAIANERPITSSVHVRQALAFCLDYDVLPREFLKGHGEKIYGYYGLGQWMPEAAGNNLDRLPRYQLDLDKANQLLIMDGWLYNKDGGDYHKGDPGLRYLKTANGGLEPFILKMIVTPENKAAYLVLDMLRENLGKIGGEVISEEMSFVQALSQHYRQDQRTFDLFFLGSNFVYFFDPSKTYHIGEEYQGTINTSGLQDEKLAALATAVTRVPSQDREAFLKGWLAFQTYWAEVLPMIPLYSNTYYDLYTPDLTDYHPESYWNWGTAILYASLNR